MSRRWLLRAAGAGGLGLMASRAFAQQATVHLPLPSGPTTRDIVTDFPQKGPMILQRVRPPLLETPWEVFDKGVFTPNDQFFVRWHWSSIPSDVNVDTFRLAVGGHVERPLSLSLQDLVKDLPRVDLAAVNQCSGNSRGFFAPRMPGAQWANGAMGNAMWGGVRLKDVLDRAGVKAGAIQVRFKGLEEPMMPDAPHFMKSLTLDHARDGEVMIAYAMNDAQLPLLNGFPLRLVVPGWYSTYWVKMLSDIEVLDQPDTNYWTKSAYTIPDTPNANVTPGQTGVKMVPLTRMIPRSFVTNLAEGARVPAGKAFEVRGIAFGGDCGVAAVDVSLDGGKTWAASVLGKDEGKYSFRQWSAPVTPPAPGASALLVRCTNTKGEVQPMVPNWNDHGFMRNVIERTPFTAT